MPDIIYNFTDCTEATISTPTTNLEFLSDINNTNTSGKDYTNIECYRLTYSLNCCEDNVLDLPVPYDINFNIINCQSVTVLGTPEQPTSARNSRTSITPLKKDTQ